MNTPVTSFNQRTGPDVVSNKPLATSPPVTPLLNRLSKSVETATMLLRCRQQVQLGVLQLDARSGPAITRRFSRSGRSIYTAEGHALSVTIQNCHFICRKLALVLYILYNESCVPSLSVRCNLHVFAVIPQDNSYFKAVQIGDIDYLRRAISCGLLPMSVTAPGGYTILHVGIDLSQSR